MKKNIFLLFFLLSVSSIQGQLQDFEGIWVSNETEFLTSFIINEKLNSVKGTTFSFTSDAKVNEDVYFFNNDSLKTICENKANGYKVNVLYTLLNKNVMTAKITGDIDTNIKYVRMY